MCYCLPYCTGNEKCLHSFCEKEKFCSPLQYGACCKRCHTLFFYFAKQDMKKYTDRRYAHNICIFQCLKLFGILVLRTLSDKVILWVRSCAIVMAVPYGYHFWVNIQMFWLLKCILHHRSKPMRSGGL